MIRSFDEEIDVREKAQKPLRTADQIGTLALHQIAEHLPFGFVCLCGAELADLNAPLGDARIGGRQLAIAVHQAQELEALAEVGLAEPQRPEGAADLADAMEGYSEDGRLEEYGLDGLADHLAAMGYRKTTKEN